MKKTEWFRRTTWTPTDQKEFRDRLSRCRGKYGKPQYVRIQASYLAGAGHTQASLELLDEFLRDYPDSSELASARLQRADCFLRMRDVEAALSEFRAALQAERQWPNYQTTCWLDFPWHIVCHRMTTLYDEASAVLDEFLPIRKLLFPVEEYKYSAIRAILNYRGGNVRSARQFASTAMKSAEATHSGFRYHPNIGLVNKSDREIRSDLVKILQSKEPSDLV